MEGIGGKEDGTLPPQGNECHTDGPIPLTTFAPCVILITDRFHTARLEDEMASFCVITDELSESGRELTMVNPLIVAAVQQWPLILLRQAAGLCVQQQV